MIQIQLSQGLKVFGLDPREWALRPISRRRYILHNLIDQNFTLTGMTRRRGSRMEWAELQLRSV